MIITIEVADLPPGLAVVVAVVGDKMAVEVGTGYTLQELLGAIGPALSRAINLMLAPADA